jgi:hypothetical protein
LIKNNMQKFFFSCLYLLGAFCIVIIGMVLSAKVSSLLLASTLMSFANLFVISLLSYWIYTLWALQNVTRINVVGCTRLTGVLFTLAFLSMAAIATLTSILMRRDGNYSDHHIYIAIYPFLVLMSALFGPACLGLIMKKNQNQ